MRTERETAGDERDRAIWRSNARTGHLLNVFVLVIDTAYVVATWTSGAHRPFLLGLNLAAILAVVVALVVVPEQEVAASPRRDLIFAGWILVGALLITVAVVADGGSSSPLTWLLPISVMFTAVAHRPSMVWLSGTFAVAGYLIVVVAGPGSVAAPATLTRLGYLVALTYAAASAARSRWDHHDAQATIRHELSHLADVDGLTGVLNHRAFHERLEAEVAACRRRSLTVTVLLVDLDHFKSVNDRFGHLVGDEVLRNVGAAIERSLRPGDVVGRVGGEEFAACLGAATMAEAERLAERVRLAVAQIVDPEPITASIGIGSAGGAAGTAADALRGADEALYRAKRQGRNQTCWMRVA